MNREDAHGKAKRLAKALARRHQAASTLIAGARLHRLDVAPDSLIETTKDFWAADDEITRLRKEKRL